MALHHAPILHTIYQATPGYFALLGSRVPSISEVQGEIASALSDPRRRLELLHDERGRLVGLLDYKCDYPQPGDVTINLLMICEQWQNAGRGGQVVRELEARLPSGTRRVLASVLGDNPRGARFWARLGYRFALDARPAMTWYAKTLRGPEQDGALAGDLSAALG